MLFNKPPNYNFFKTFLCACYPVLRSYNNHKFNFRSSVFISCLSPSGKTFITCHVVFNETAFPFALPNNPFISDNKSVQNLHLLQLFL